MDTFKENLCSFCKSVNFLGMQVRKSQIFIIKPQIANPQISTKYCTALSQSSPKSRLFIRFYCVQILSRALYSTFVRRKSMYLLTCGSFKSATHKKVRSANRKSAKSNLRKVRKSSKLFRSAKLRICDLRNLFPDLPPLVR